MDYSSISRKNRFAITTLSFILLFFFTILLFTKRTLQPSVSIYQQSFSLTTSNISDTEPPSAAAAEPPPAAAAEPPPAAASEPPPAAASEPPPAAAVDPLNTSTQHDPIPSIPQADEVLDHSSNGIDDQVKKPNNLVVHKGEERKRESCDLYSGSWVKDEEYPIYKPGSCPYVDEAFDCGANGRKDSDYLKWRWKPHQCHLPRFNATDFLERLRGKKVMLVGDSVNRNQFESFLCLLHEGLTNKSKMYEVYGHPLSKGRGYFLFKIEDYDCTVEFVRSHFLVREGVRGNAPGHSSQTLAIDRIDKSSGKWKRADIIIFNTGHWWVHGKTARGINYYKEGDYIYPKFDSMEAYRRALKTWGKWIDKNIKPAKQLVFFRGYSPAHFRGGDWDSGGSCHGETEPILKRGGDFFGTYPPKMKIVEEVIREMKVPVVLVNITKLSNFRKDGHPSIYRKKNVSVRRQDCSHWCLPGVPDTWNELIYATLLLNEQFSGG